jgi:hypothetical protein
MSSHIAFVRRSFLSVFKESSNWIRLVCTAWGPVPWYATFVPRLRTSLTSAFRTRVYCSEIFGNSIRSYGMAVAAASQWLFKCVLVASSTEHWSDTPSSPSFAQALVTPTIFANLSRGRAFFMFGSINMGM